MSGRSSSGEVGAEERAGEATLATEGGAEILSAA